MNIAQIKAELAQLDAQTAGCPEPRHRVEVLQLRQALHRRQLLQAELRRMERLADLSPTSRERLRQAFSAFDDQTFERLLAMDETALAQLLP